MISLSSNEKETASPWVPSRRVVSNVKMRMIVARGWWLVLRGGCRHGVGWDAGFLSLFQKCHHFAELAADALDRLIAGGLAHGEEILAAGFVLPDPFAGELAGLDLGQDLAHLGAGFFGHDPLAAGVVAVFGRVRDRVAHVGQTAFLNQIDNRSEERRVGKECRS